jgi:hypothetical protein
MNKGSLLLLAFVILGCDLGGKHKQKDGLCFLPGFDASDVNWWCNDQVIAVYGSGYASGDYIGGLCPNLVKCSCNNDSAEFCAGNDGADCLTAYKAVDKCVKGGFTCPAGVWETDFGYRACGDRNVVTRTDIVESSPGVFSMNMVTGPFSPSDPSASPLDCVYLFYKTLSVSFQDRTLVSTLQYEPVTSPQQIITSTMTMRSDCLQADVGNVATNCLTCTAEGNCSGDGSQSCTSPTLVAKHIYP